MDAITLTNDATGDWTSTDASHDGSLVTSDNITITSDVIGFANRKVIRWGFSGGTKWIKRVRARYTPTNSDQFMTNFAFYQKEITNSNYVSGVKIYKDAGSGSPPVNEYNVVNDMDVTFDSPVEADKLELQFWTNGTTNVNISIQEIEAWSEDSPNIGLLQAQLLASAVGTIESTTASFDGDITTSDSAIFYETSTESIQHNFRDTQGSIITRNLSRIEISGYTYQPEGQASPGSPAYWELQYIPKGESGNTGNYITIKTYTPDSLYSSECFNVAYKLPAQVQADGFFIKMFLDGDMGSGLTISFQEVEAWYKPDMTGPDPLYKPGDI